MTNEIIVKDNSALMPAMTIDEAAYRYNAVVEFTKKMMKKGKDYGTIPGTGDKPTLLKPGAEKLCSLFGFYPEFELVDSIRDFDNGVFYFQYRCVLYRNGEKIASGVGSCNSKEKKYRYRYIYENKATKEDKANAVSVETKSGRYGAYKVYKVENSEPFELVNTIDKMAQKRALVAATLIGANASEFYTQDIEDMGFNEGDFSEITGDHQPTEEQIDQALADAGPEAVPVDEPMTVEKACAVTNSEGEMYGDLSNDKLSAMTIGINKGLKKAGLTDEEREFYQEKLDAIKVILQARNDGSLS